MSSHPPPSVERISSSLIKPSPSPSPPPQANSSTSTEANAQRLEFIHLARWDLASLSFSYMQTGLLFNPNSSHMDASTIRETIIPSLKTSLSRSLFHFYPLAGRLTFNTQSEPSVSLHVFISCNDAGAEFIHAVAPEITVADVVVPADWTCAARVLYPLADTVASCDGDSLPLLAVQLTELGGGALFLGCSLNHAVADGRSFFHFLSSWSEIAGDADISLPPVLRRWFPSHIHPPIRLAFSLPDEFTLRIPQMQPLRCRIFHFTIESISNLKSKAMQDESKSCGGDPTPRISSFQALIAHVWRSVTRARKLAVEEETVLVMAVDNRSRLDPPLSHGYLGNCVGGATVQATAGELLASELGSVARMLNKSVASHTDVAIRAEYEKWVERPVVRPITSKGRGDLFVGGSPRFGISSVSGFGLGELVAYRKGAPNRFDGLVMGAAGTGGKRGMDLHLSLAPEVMCALEADRDFISSTTSCCNR